MMRPAIAKHSTWRNQANKQNLIDIKNFKKDPNIVAKVN